MVNRLIERFKIIEKNELCIENLQNNEKRYFRSLLINKKLQHFIRNTAELLWAYKGEDSGNVLMLKDYYHGYVLFINLLKKSVLKIGYSDPGHYLFLKNINDYKNKYEFCHAMYRIIVDCIVFRAKYSYSKFDEDINVCSKYSFYGKVYNFYSIADHFLDRYYINEQ